MLPKLYSAVALGLVCVASWSVAPAAAQDAWTRGKRGKNRVRPAEEAKEPDPSVFGNFAQMNELASKGGGDQYLAQLMEALGEMGDMDMDQVMAQSMQMFSEAMDSPEMQAMLTDPEKMRETMMPMLEMLGGDKDKFEEMLADPDQMKANMEKGLAEVKKMFSDPNALKQMTDEFMKGMSAAMDPAVQAGVMDMITKLSSGDEAAMAEVMNELGPEFGEVAAMLSDPSKAAELAELQKQLLGAAGGGDLAESMKQLLDDPVLAAKLQAAGGVAA